MQAMTTTAKASLISQRSTSSTDQPAAASAFLIAGTGAVVNQQITPAVQWALRQGWRRFMLVGSDYVYPHAAHAAVDDLVGKWRGEIVGEYLVPLGRRDFAPFIEAIERARPDVILNTVNGDANIALFRSWFDLNFGKHPENLNLRLVADSAEVIIKALLDDMRAMAYLGQYYAAKIEAATQLAFYQTYRVIFLICSYLSL